jgi:hypothetical protein
VTPLLLRHENHCPSCRQQRQRTLTTTGSTHGSQLTATKRSAFSGRIEALGRAVFPSSSVWIAWPKKASGVPTDITEDTVREIALPLGLVDVKVCAIDETWSGLKLMWRKELRG